MLYWDERIGGVGVGWGRGILICKSFPYIEEDQNAWEKHERVIQLSKRSLKV